MSFAPKLEGLPVAGLLVSPSGLTLYGNDACTRMLGVVGSDWTGSVHPDDRTVAATLARRGGERVEIRVPSGAGWKWVVASSFPCDEGHTVWLMEIGSDREDALQSLRRERELNDQKNRFISVVSHEFRTPLTVILSSAELLEHYGAKWDADRKALHYKKIHTAVSVVTTLLDNVGLYGRAESGSLEMRPQRFAPSAFVSEIIAEAGATLPAGQEILCQDETVGRFLESDPKLLRHALLNLLANAVRYSPHGTAVEVRSSWSGSSWMVEILDRGIGLLPGDADRVWEKFQRGSNTDGISGTGLGLPIVRRCCDILGAEVHLAGRPEGGCAARLVVPTMMRTEDAPENGMIAT